MLNSNKLNLGLIGRKLSHSFSKRYFGEKYGITTYSLIELATIDDLQETVSRMRLDGFNVTIPYKCDIIPLLDELDPVAQEIGAVNTVVRRKMENGRYKMYGYNTDAPAFLETLKAHLAPHNRRALILGSGGVSRAVAWALRQLDIEYRIVSRTPPTPSKNITYTDAYNLVEKEDFTIIINATPVGMYPDIDATPWSRPELLTPLHLCYDLIYNPSPTLFLQQAASRGATTIDGLTMLHRQADLAYKIWTSTTQ